jgi:hypothetical protein
MATDKELEQYARDCVRLAGLTDDPTIREPLLKMAREWMEIARAEQQQVNGAKRKWSLAIEGGAKPRGECLPSQ